MDIILAMLITAYVPLAGAPNGGAYGAHCHLGICTRLQVGHVACGKAYPFHAVFVIDDKPYICLDRGGAITNDRLDVVFPTLKSAVQWGVQRKRVQAWLPGRYEEFQRELTKRGLQ